MRDHIYGGEREQVVGSGGGQCANIRGLFKECPTKESVERLFTAEEPLNIYFILAVLGHFRYRAIHGPALLCPNCSEHQREAATPASGLRNIRQIGLLSTSHHVEGEPSKLRERPTTRLPGTSFGRDIQYLHKRPPHAD